MKQQSAEIMSFRELLSNDDKIIAKRTAITKSSKAQMEQGATTVHEYLGELDAQNEATQNQILHKVQLLQAQYNYQNTTGN